MSSIVVLLIFASSTYLTWRRGVAWAFACVYIPVLVFLSATKSISLPLLPDMTSQFAVGYGVLAGLVLRGGERVPFRLNVLDVLMVALWLVAAGAAGAAEGMEMARNTIGDGFFDWLTPYFLARWSFVSTQGRRAALWSCCTCAIIVALMSPVELSRFQPQFWSRLLDQFGLYTPANSMPLYRFGLARAQTTFHQPMDQGNCGMLLAGLIAIFASTTAVGLRNGKTLLGLGAAVFVSLASLSFSAFANIAAGAGAYAALRFMPSLARGSVVYVMLGILAGLGVTGHLLKRPLGERDDRFGQTVDDSMYMRTRIVQESMPVVLDAGWSGYGKDGVEGELKNRSPDKDYIKSIDNTYLLMIMQRGWPYFLLFMLIPFYVAWRTMAVWAVAPADSQRIPVAAATAVIFSIMIVMYTIFFGFVYSKLWLVMLGVFSTLTDVLLGRIYLESERAIRQPADPRGAYASGFPVAATRGL